MISENQINILIVFAKPDDAEERKLRHMHSIALGMFANRNKY